MTQKTKAPTAMIEWLVTEYGWTTHEAIDHANPVCEWISKNPIVPTDEELFGVSGSLPIKMAQIVWSERDRALLAEWQRRIFLAPKPEVPEEIKDLLSDSQGKIEVASSVINSAVIEAYRRGQQSKENQ